MACSPLKLHKLIVCFLVVFPYIGVSKASADSSNISELLLFAKQYQESKTDVTPAEKTDDKTKLFSSEKPESIRQSNKSQKAGKQQNKIKKPDFKPKEAPIKSNLAEVDENITDKKSTMLPEQPAAVVPLSKRMEDLQQLGAGIRQALSLTASEKQVQSLVVSAREREELAKKLVDSVRLDNDGLRNQLVVLQETVEQQRSDQNKHHTKLKSDVKKQQAALAIAEKEAAQLKQQLTALQQALSEQQTANKVQSDKLKNHHLAVKQANESVEAQQHKLDELQQTLALKENSVVELNAAIESLESERDALKQRETALASADLLKSPAGQKSYAIGVSLAHDILALENEHQEIGVSTDKNSLLAGILDVFTDEQQLKLSPEKLLQAKQAAEDEANQARTKHAANVRQQGEKFLASFKKQKGVKPSDAGFWFKVDYAGDESIADDATVSIVVKETLTDGTVVQDMELADKVLSRPIADFPPLFQAAIRELRNHGSLTMVVPPEKAYGDKGYAPKVPPGATMIYVLRIAEVLDADAKAKI